MIGKIWFCFVFFLFRCFFIIFCGLKVRGLENLKIKGAFIMTANHASYCDPPLFAAISHRRVNCMAKKELFDIPLLSLFIKTLGAFPVDREGNDTSAVKKAIKLLKEGEIVGIFPEGQRVKGDKRGEASTGVALIAKQADVPVVPISIIGSANAIKINKKIPSFSKIELIVHKPIRYEKADPNLKEKENMRIFTDKIMDIVYYDIESRRSE